MNVEYEIQKLRADLNSLQTAFWQAQKNNSNIVNRVDNASNKVVAITPYTETKTAYIGDTEVVFADVPQGNLSVFSDKPINYSIERINNTVAVTFDALDEVTTVTISIQ